MYVPHSLRLKDPELVSRWEQIVPFLREAPKWPRALIFDNAAVTLHSAVVHRMSLDATYVFVQYVEMSEFDSAQQDGGQVVFTTYKVNTKVPFVIRDLEVVSPKKSNSRAAGPWWSVWWDGVRQARHRLRLATTTNLLLPSADELDALLFTLRDARQSVCDTRRAGSDGEGS